jgi:hypothetical protein
MCEEVKSGLSKEYQQGQKSFMTKGRQVCANIFAIGLKFVNKTILKYCLNASVPVTTV